MNPNWKRPKTLYSKTEHIISSCGGLYITFGYTDEERTKLVEVSATIGKCGTCPNVQLNTICRLISIILQSPLSRKKCLKKFRKFETITCGNSFTHDDKTYTSCDDIIIKRVISELQK